jgi:hypothetical protein
MNKKNKDEKIIKVGSPKVGSPRLLKDTKKKRTSDSDEQSVHTNHTVKSQVSVIRTRKNIEFVGTDLPEHIKEIRKNFAKILKINEQKKILLDDNFFKENYGPQDDINNRISKSVEKFFKQAVMERLNLTSTKKLTS